MEMSCKSGSCSLIHRVTNIVEPLDLAALFPQAQPLELELGSGDGTFMAQYAAQHRERNFIGVERLLGRVRKLERKGLRVGLTNLRIIRLEAAYLAQYMLPTEAISALHIYFPDPWPKKRHHKNRLINDEFTRLLERILVPQGIVYLRTDNLEYFEWILAAFATNPHFQKVETPPELAALVTDFERDFNAQGIPTLRAAYSRMT